MGLVFGDGEQLELFPPGPLFEGKEKSSKQTTSSAPMAALNRAIVRMSNKETDPKEKARLWELAKNPPSE